MSIKPQIDRIVVNIAIEVFFMKKVLKPAAGIVCALSVLLTGVAVFAEETKTTPTGIAYGNIGTTIETWASENPSDYSSFVTAVFDGDGIIYQGAFGFADKENNIAATTDTVYEWGSVTKLTVWVSVMQLYEQGRIDLNADIRTYLPEGFLKNLKYDDPVTMLNLMNHNAGWGEGTWSIQTADPEEIVSLGDALSQSEPPQIYRPGEVCSYSNWGAALAGYIVECITGQSFADYVHENIFEPLGMEHTSILPDHSDNARVQEKRKELVSYSFDGSAWNSNGHQLIYINLYPAGAATGTIGDMALFAQSFVREDNPLFEKTETRELLLSPSLYLGDTDFVVGCHGLWTEDRENASLIGHSGGTNACSSDLVFDRDTGLGAVYMTAGGWPAVPKLLFGDMASYDLSSYTGSVTVPGALKGTYAGCRSIRHGIYKVMGLFSMLPLNYNGNNEYTVSSMATFTQVSDNMLILKQDENTYPAYVYKTSDGTTIISLGSQSFASENSLKISLYLLVVMAVITVAGIFMLFYRAISLLTKKHISYSGSLFVGLSQLCRIACLLPLILLASKYSEQYGLTHTQGYIVFAIEAVCFVIFAISFCMSALGLFKKDTEGFLRLKYALSVIGNGVSIATIFAFELLNIWGV